MSMKIGILNCEIRQDSGIIDKNDLNRRFTELLGSKYFEFSLYCVSDGVFPLKAGDCSGYLITGSKAGVYDSCSWIADLSSFIRECFSKEIPLVGICFGHQILAHSLGGRAEKSKKGWGLGCRTVPLVSSQPWLSESITTTALYYCHQDQVAELPPEGAVLAGDDFCPVAAFAIEDLVFGLQGHPEFDLDLMKRILDSNQESFPANTLKEARASLKIPPDSKEAARWITNFLLFRKPAQNLK